MDIVNVVKQHPIPIAVGGVVILLLVMGGKSSSGSGSNAAATLQSQQIATAGNTAIATINANVAIQKGAQTADVQKAVLSKQGQEAIARTGLVASMFDTKTKAQATLAGMDIQSQLSQTLGFYQHQDNIQNSNNNLILGQKSIDAGVKMNADKLATTMALQSENNNSKLTALAKTLDLQGFLAGLTSGTSKELTTMNNASTKDLLGMQLDYKRGADNLSANTQYNSLIATLGAKAGADQLTAANLPLIYANSQALAAIAAQNSQAMATIAGSAANTTANAASRSSDANTAGSWVSTIASIAALFI